MNRIKQWLREALWRRIPPLENEGFWKEWADAAGARPETFLTVHARPRRAESLGTEADPWLEFPRTAIVLQGPLLREDAFTRETIAIYRGHFPGHPIILSTWAAEDRAEIEACRAAGAEVVLSEAPSVAGPANINRQIVSTRAGLQKCAELGVTHALKTRTDQRMYNPNALAFLHSAQRAFPLREQIGGQRERLIGVSLNTLKYRRYGLSDMLLFGALDDVIRYWSCELDRRSEAPPAPFGKHAELRLCEVYLQSSFLESLGRPLTWTIADSWTAWAEHFCVIDSVALDLYWPKYASYREYRRLDYGPPHTGQELSFADWLILYGRSWHPSAVAETACQLDWNTPLPAHPAAI